MHGRFRQDIDGRELKIHVSTEVTLVGDSSIGYCVAIMYSQRVEILERALVLLAQSLAFEERATFEQQVAKQDELIRFAKLQAMESMGILPRADFG